MPRMGTSKLSLRPCASESSAKRDIVRKFAVLTINLGNSIVSSSTPKLVLQAYYINSVAVNRNSTTLLILTLAAEFGR